MRRPNALLLSALLMGIAGAPALAAEPSAAEMAAVHQAEARGELLYHLDRAAWVSTDELLKALPDPGAVGVAGWIVDVEGDHLKAIYYRGGDQPSAVFAADVRNDAVVASQVFTGQSVPLTERQRRMAAARKTASHQDTPRCTNGPMNTVVIPPEGPDAPIEVYVLSAQVTMEELPFGGHYKIMVGPDGAVTAQRKFTNACMNMPLNRSKGSEALGISHLLDTTPTEIHVFEARQIPMPLYVLTPTVVPASANDPFRVWSVDHGAIRFVQEQQNEAPKRK